MMHFDFKMASMYAMKCMHLNFEIYFTVLCLLYCTSVVEYTR